jgi:hypothetical protein
LEQNLVCFYNQAWKKPSERRNYGKKRQIRKICGQSCKFQTNPKFAKQNRETVWAGKGELLPEKVG